MALYRTVSMSFWTDSKIVDDFTPEDRYFYLYLFTNPHTNLCGCFEISLKQVALETGYSKETVVSLIKRFQNVHDVLRYSEQTKEILLLNWSKYNWTASDKFRKPLLEQINQVKSSAFQSYLIAIYNGTDTVSIPYEYPIDTSNANTNTVTNTNTINQVDKSNEHKRAEVEAVFEALWKAYPEKKGKGRVTYADKRKLAEIGVEELIRAIERYKAEVNEQEWRHWQNGSTFFHSGYIDYLDENYVKSVQKKSRPPTSGFVNEVKHDDYDMRDLEIRLLNG